YLSLLCHFTKNYDTRISSLVPPEKLAQCILNLFMNCPDNLSQHRKDLTAAMRSLISTSYRLAFVPIVEQFMNDDIFIGNGWTTREAYRSVAYGVIYDLLHHVRDQLTLQQCHTAINVYSRNLFDESLTMMIHIMTCRLML